MIPAMTTLEYAAIHLRVPMSGNPDLDQMIAVAAMRDASLAAMAAIIGKAPTMATPVDQPNPNVKAIVGGSMDYAQCLFSEIENRDE